MRQFDFHEFMAYIAPGMLLLAILLVISPEYYSVLSLSDVSFGGFGLWLVVSYALGQMLQALGNLLEKAWWSVSGGIPSDWVRNKKHTLLSAQQQIELEKRSRSLVDRSDLQIDPSLSQEEWHSIVCQIYAVIMTAGLNKRVDVFNGNYGLCRGLSAAFGIAFILNITAHWTEWQMHLLWLALFSLSLYRMHRFSRHYARELFIQFLCTPTSECDKQ